jgi:hypothetical protein
MNLDPQCPKLPPRVSADRLERLYHAYNRREYVHPDPLEFLYHYPDPEEREIVALVAASLAYGRVARILISVSEVLERMQPSPRSFVAGTSEADMKQAFGGFVHRFATGDALSALLTGARRILQRHGSLCRLFVSGLSPGDDSVVPALTAFVRILADACPADFTSSCDGWFAAMRWIRVAGRAFHPLCSSSRWTSTCTASAASWG